MTTKKKTATKAAKKPAAKQVKTAPIPGLSDDEATRMRKADGIYLVGRVDGFDDVAWYEEGAHLSLAEAREAAKDAANDTYDDNAIIVIARAQVVEVARREGVTFVPVQGK